MILMLRAVQGYGCFFFYCLIIRNDITLSTWNINAAAYYILSIFLEIM
jgi:hypothetical protein